MKSYLLIAGLFLLIFSCRQEPEVENDVELATEAFLAHQGDRPFDLAITYPSIQESGAYEIQKAAYWANHQSNDLAGYKAALTSTGAQQLLATDHAAAGYLPRSGWVANGDTIIAAAYTLPFIEVELGFYTNRKISTPVADTTQLKSLVASVYPVIEFPDIGFENIQEVKLTTFIAHNTAAKQFITGTATPTEQAPNLNTLTCSLSKSDSLLAEAKGGDALGNQWEALRFLINQRIEMGATIEPDDVLITGSLGKLFPFIPGNYTANYGTLGTLNFVIK